MSLDSRELSAQYRDSANLSARQRIYRFGRGGNSFGEWVLQRLKLPINARVLDVGCGNATLWGKGGFRIPAGWQLLLIDLSGGMLKDANHELSDATKRVRFVRGDVQRLPIRDSVVDGVVANHMLYHVPDRNAALAEVARVLKPGGQFLATTNSLHHLRKLKELIERFVPGGLSMVADAFCLENAAAQVAPFFSDVQVETQSGELRVTDAEAVVDYVLSIERATQSLRGDRIKELREIVQREIEIRGAFVIGTETGMVRARKP